MKFVENEYPEFKDNISTCRSPQGMFSAVLKEYYRDEKHAQGKKNHGNLHYALHGQEDGG